MFRSIYFFLFFALLSCTKLGASVPDSLLFRRYPSQLQSYKDYLEHYRPEQIAVWFDETGRFNSDTLLSRIAVDGEKSVIDELEYYITHVINFMPADEKVSEIKKIGEYARRYKSKTLKLLAEMEEADIHASDEDKLESLERLAEYYKTDFGHYMTIRYEIFRKVLSGSRYSVAFRMARELTDELERITEKEFRKKKSAYYYIGELYYLFRDYENAIPALEKSLSDTISYFYERSNFQARNTLGLYYRTQGELGKSDGYFLSMLADTSIVKFKPMYDAMAIANLGRNYKLRGDYDEALRLLHHSLLLSDANGDYPFSAGVTTDMGDCYLALGRLDRAKDMIDTTYIYMNIFLSNGRYIHNNLKLYPLMSKYYGRTGNEALAAAYLDSTLVANKRYEDEFSALTIMRAEQELHDSQQAAAQKQIQSRNRQLVLAGILLIMAISASVLLAWFYKRKRDAYRELVYKSQQWAGIAAPRSEEAESAEESAHSIDTSIPVIEEIERLMIDEKLYVNPEFSLGILSDMIGKDRRIVSAIINQYAQKNFTTYINEYRIKESILLMSDPNNKNISINGIALDSGFNDRKNFHRIFKQYTGLTPAAFRDNI